MEALVESIRERTGAELVNEPLRWEHGLWPGSGALQKKLDAGWEVRAVHGVLPRAFAFPWLLAVAYGGSPSRLSIMLAVRVRFVRGATRVAQGTDAVATHEVNLARRLGYGLEVSTEGGLFEADSPLSGRDFPHALLDSELVELLIEEASRLIERLEMQRN